MAQNRLVIPHLKKESEYPTSSAFSQENKKKKQAQIA